MFCVICSYTQRVLYSTGMYLYLLFINTMCVVMAITAERTVRDTHDRVTRVRCCFTLLDNHAVAGDAMFSSVLIG